MALRKWIVMGALVLAAAPAFAGGGAFRQQFAQERAALFAQADADGDGAHTPAEFETFRQLVRQKIAEHRFARADANGDGKVTLAELEAAGPRHGGCRHQGPETSPGQ